MAEEVSELRRHICSISTTEAPFSAGLLQKNESSLFDAIYPARQKARIRLIGEENTTGTSFRGFDTFSVSATDNRQVLEFTPSFYQITCALPGDELSVADTEDKVLDMMKLTIQSDTEDMADDLGTIFYADGIKNFIPKRSNLLYS